MQRFYKQDYPVFILTFLVLLIGISLIVGSYLFNIIKILSTPVEVLPYLLHVKPPIFKWAYNYLILGIFLSLIGVISLIYLIFFRKINKKRLKAFKLTNFTIITLLAIKFRAKLV